MNTRTEYVSHLFRCAELDAKPLTYARFLRIVRQIENEIPSILRRQAA